MLLIDSPEQKPVDGKLELRQRIAEREAELATIVAEAFPEVIIDPLPISSRGPRLLSLEELREVEYHLGQRVHRARADLARLREEQHQARLLVEEMLRNPEGYRGCRVSLREMGQPGCGVYRVVPRLGIIGRMRGWWCVKLSSGCP